MTRPLFAPLVDRLGSVTESPTSPLVVRCLDVVPVLPEEAAPAQAHPWDATSRHIERLKMANLPLAVSEAERWINDVLEQIDRHPEDTEAGTVADLQFCSALSTYSGLLRHLGQRHDAALTSHHVLRVLSTVPYTTLTGFALHRAAYILADLGYVADGLVASHHAVAIHQMTRGGQHHKAIALAGLGAYHLFYRRAFADARASYMHALEILLAHDDLHMTTTVEHGIAYSFLMEGRPDEARGRLAILYEHTPDIEPDHAVRLAWCEAEIDAAAEEWGAALGRYEQVLAEALRSAEISVPILITFDIARILISSHAKLDRWRRWHDQIKRIVEKLSRAEHATLEPFVDAMHEGELDLSLLDATTVAFKHARNRMLLGMGRPGAAGRPELRGALSAA